VIFWLGTRGNSRIYPLSTLLSFRSVPLPSFFRVLATTEGEKRQYGSAVDINHTLMKSSGQSLLVHQSSDVSSI
jgi:hypothetical protein